MAANRSQVGYTTSPAVGLTYTPERLRALIGIWLASSLRPFALVNDTGFQDILCMFDPSVSIPLQPTISRNVREMYFIAWENLAVLLEIISLLLHVGSFADILTECSRQEAHCIRWLDLAKCTFFHRSQHLLPVQWLYTIPST